MNEPRVIGLAGVGLQVPEVRVAEKFYGTFGLQAQSRGSGIGFRSTGGASDEILVLPGAPQKRMHHVSFFIRPQDEQPFADKLKSKGLHPSSRDERPGIGSRIPGARGSTSPPASLPIRRNRP